MTDKKKPDEVVEWLHFICKFIYWSGLGDYWYEPTKRSTLRKISYTILALANQTYFIAMVCCELASFFKTKYLPAELTDALQYSVSHAFVPVKWLLMIIHRERIRKLLKMMLVSSREMYVNEQIEREQLRKSHVYCFALALSMFAALTSALIDSLVRYFRTDLPWRTLVTIYPDYDDISWAAYGFRALSTFFWYHFITTMLTADFLAITCLIYVAFKFRSLQCYFLSIGTRFEQNSLEKSQEELENDMRLEFVNGLKLHKEILWCAHSIQSALGNVYSIVITQSFTLYANGLIKMMMNEERSLMYFLAAGTCIGCMLILCGVYMWTAGEITYEASLVSEAMFHSGWNLCSARARMRQLLVVGIIRSQVPVIMTAFGVLDLSYDNFIKILKTSYSVFAVFY